MRFTPQKIDELIRQIKQGQINALLLYGPDSGLIDSLCKKIANSGNYLERSVAYSQILESDISCALGSLNLFSDKELIKIQDVPNSIESSLCTAIETTQFSNFAIFIAKEPSKNAAIRKFFDSSSYAASIGCYAPDNLGAMITSHLNGYFIDNQARQYLMQHLPCDRSAFNSEIEKLKIFFSDKKIVGIRDLQSIISCANQAELDEVFFAFIQGNFAKYLEKLQTVKQKGANDILIIRSLIRYCLSLAVILKANQPLEKAVLTLNPPIFFKYITTFVSIASSVSKQFVNQTLNILYDAEKKLKQGESMQLLESLCLYQNELIEIYSK